MQPDLKQSVTLDADAKRQAQANTLLTVCLEQIDSTNDHAKRIWHAGARNQIKQPVCFTAKQQTMGRGTYGRAWVSPSGYGLYATLLWPACYLETPPHPDCYPWTQSVAALTWQWVIATFPSLRGSVSIKPVNDLMAGSRKLGGILVEALHYQGCPAAWVLGLGINWLTPANPPPDYPARAIALDALLDGRNAAGPGLPEHFAEAIASYLVTGIGTYPAEALHNLYRKGVSTDK